MLVIEKQQNKAVLKRYRVRNKESRQIVASFDSAREAQTYARTHGGSRFKIEDSHAGMDEGEEVDSSLCEVAPPDPKMEKWIEANKQRFKDKYGEDKGEEILYATAWKRHQQNEQLKEADDIDVPPTTSSFPKIRLALSQRFKVHPAKADQKELDWAYRYVARTAGKEVADRERSALKAFRKSQW